MAAKKPTSMQAKIFNAVMDMREDVGSLKGDMAVVKRDMATLKSDVSVLKSDVGVLKSDVGVLKSDVGVLKSDVAWMKEKLKHHDATFDAMGKVVLETKAALDEHLKRTAA